MKKSMVDSINYKNVRLTSSHRLKTLTDEKKTACLSDDLADPAPKKFIFKSKTQQSSSGLSNAISHDMLASKQQPMVRSESNSGPKFKLKRYSSSDLELSPKKKRNSEPEESPDTFTRVSPNRTPKKIFTKSKSGSVEDEDDLFDGVVDLVGNIDSQIKKQCNSQTSPNDRKSQRLAARQASKDSKTPSPTKTSLPPSPPSSTASHKLEVVQQCNKKKSPSPKKAEPTGLSKYSLDDLLNDDDTETGQVKKSKFKLVSKTSSTSSGSLTSASQSTITLASSQSTVGVSSSLASSSTSSMPKIFNFKARSNSNPTVFKIDFDDNQENGTGNEEKPASTSTKQSSNSSETSTKSKNDIIYLRNSRKAYQCEQLGEEQAFMDNLNYLLDGLGNGNKLSDRCLSALKLAEECVSSEFRMSLRSMASYDDKQGSLLTRLFTPLEDSVKYKSLSLCTSLILYALTQDKLFMELNKQIFDLITRVVNWNEENDIEVSLNTVEEIVDTYSYLDDVRSVDAHERHVREYQQMTPSRVRSSTSSSLANSPTGSASKDTESLNEGTVADELVYKKIYNNAWKIYKKLCSNYNLDQNFTVQSSPDEYEINFNPRLLFLDCLLNITRHTSKSLIVNDLLRTELRENRIIDKVVFRTRVLFERIVLLNKLKSASTESDNDLVVYLYSKLDASLFFLEILTQSSSQGSERSESRAKTGLKAILPPPDLETEQSVTKKHVDSPVHTLNQNYLVDLSNNFVLKLIKTMMNYLYEEMSEAVAHRDLEKHPISTCTTESIKQIFLFMINLTHHNEYTTSKILNDAKLLELLFKFVILFNNDKYQPFDLNVMVLGALVNLFVYSYKQKSSLKLLRLKCHSQTSFDIILNFYLAKEKMVILAEDNQENEFKRLSEQMSESHDTDNINKLIMNSIQQAGKHMEDHIIATHCALIIGYMLIDDDYVSDKKLIDVKKAKSKLMDGSFVFMVGVIKKFVVFMKILKATGFSADEHIQTITTYLSDL